MTLEIKHSNTDGARIVSNIKVQHTTILKDIKIEMQGADAGSETLSVNQQEVDSYWMEGGSFTLC